MVMKNPPHPGHSIKEACLNPLNLTVTAGAKVLGVSRQTLNKILYGQAAISPNMALRLSMAFGGSAETWLCMQVMYDLAKARKRAKGIRIKRVQRQR